MDNHKPSGALITLLGHFILSKFESETISKQIAKCSWQDSSGDPQSI